MSVGEKKKETSNIANTAKVELYEYYLSALKKGFYLETYALI